MRTRTGMKIFTMAMALFMWATTFAIDAIAQQIECSSAISQVKAVTNPAGHVITTKYQFDTPNLQPLLTTTIDAGEGCL